MLEVQRVVATEDSYTLSITVPKSLFFIYQSIFNNFEEIANDMRRKSKVADAQADYRREERDKDRVIRDGRIKQEMRQVYADALKSTGSAKEAMKVITKKFQPYFWIRNSFKKEIQAQREFEAVRLKGLGKTSQQIADALGIEASTVRKIMSNGKSQYSSP